MSFVKLEKRIGVAEAKLGASMSMRIYKGSPKAMTLISLRSQFLATTDFAKAVQFDVSVGEGESKGKIKITPSAKGVFSARKLKSGSLTIDIGHVPQLGNDEHSTHQADVTFADGAAIVSVPDWSDESDDDQDDDQNEDEQDEEEDEPPARRAVEPRRPVAPPAANGKVALPAPAKSVTHNGVTISAHSDLAYIAHNGERIEASPRGGKLVEALARVMPSCIDDAHLVARLWDAKPPVGAATQLDLICKDLVGLKKLGLEIRMHKGVGRQLVRVP